MKKNKLKVINKTSSLFKELVVSLLVIVFFMVVSPSSVAAEGLNVAVYPIHPENQITNASFFNVLVKPEEKGKMALKFENLSDKSVTLDVNIMTASTNSNGSIDYTKEQPLLNDTLEYSMNDIFKESSKIITLNKKESRVVEFDYEIPKEEFSGSLLGAFYIKERKSETSSFDFRFSQVIAIQIQESKKKIEPAFKLSDIDIMQYNKQASFMITIENLKAILLKDTDISGKITKKGSKVIKFNFNLDKQSIAPNSNLILPITIPTDIGIDAGDYKLELQINNKGKKYEYSKDFEVTALALERAGFKEDKSKMVNIFNFYYVLIGIILFVILGVSIIVFRTLKKNKTTIKKKRVKKRI